MDEYSPNQRSERSHASRPKSDNDSSVFTHFLRRDWATIDAHGVSRHHGGPGLNQRRSDAGAAARLYSLNELLFS
jgi:hypothetical protein